MPQNITDVLSGTPKPIPRRTSPSPPSSTSEAPQNLSSTSKNSRTSESSGALGYFWNTQHAKGSEGKEDKNRPKYDDDMKDQKSFVNEIWPDNQPVCHPTPKKEQSFQSPHVQRNAQGRFSRPSDFSPKDINLFPDDSDHKTERLKQPRPELTPTFQNDSYNAFVAEFDIDKRSANTDQQKPEDKLEGEVEKLKEQLARANAEKAEITSKYEKLSAICRSQRQEIHDLKQALAARTPSPSRDSSRNAAPTNERVEGTLWELQQGLFDGNSSSSDSKQWLAFTDEPKPHANAMPTNNAPKSVRTLRNSPQKKLAVGATSGTNSWGFETDAFKVVPTSGSNIHNIRAVGELNNSQQFGESRSVERKLGSQPSGWAGF